MHQNGYCCFKLVSHGPLLFFATVQSPPSGSVATVCLYVMSEVTMMTFPQKVQPFLKHLPLVLWSCLEPMATATLPTTTTGGAFYSVVLYKYI